MNHEEVVEYLAEKMMKFRRQTDNLGICAKPHCLEKYRASGQRSQYEETPMMDIKPASNPCKCTRCGTVTSQGADAYFCSFCGDNFCDSCLGYNLLYDLQELEDLLK